jgi:muramidase-2
MIGLAILLPQLAWADTDMGQVEATIGEQGAEAMTDLGPEGAPGVDVAGSAEEAITPPSEKPEETGEDTASQNSMESDATTLAAATQDVLRLYNRWSGEHLYTTSRTEYNSLGKVGWSGEGTAWAAPGSGSNPVWRLYNRWSGDHLLTSDRKEYDALGRAGWNREGVAFYSGGGVSVWRLYNRWLKAGTHLLTTDKTEYDNLIRDGWSGEGVAFYAVSARSGQTDSQRREAEVRAAINRNPTSVNDGDTITVTGKAVAESLKNFDGSTVYSVQLQRQLTIRNIPPSTVDTTPTETTDSLVLVKWLGFGYIDWWNEPQKWFVSYVGKTVTLTGRVVWRRSGKLMSYGPWLYDTRLVRVW